MSLQHLLIGSNKRINRKGKRNPLGENLRQKQRLQLLPFPSTQLFLTKILPPLQQYQSPLVPSNASVSAVIISSQTPKEEEISVSDEARKAGESLKELIVAAIKGAKDSAKETGKRLKEQTINIATTVDSTDIRSLGDNVNASVLLFEETMIKIRKESYDDQIKLLNSYKELLRTHIKVVDARGRMASKLKRGA